MSKRTTFLVCSMLVVVAFSLLATACRYTEKPLSTPVAPSADSDCISDKAIQEAVAEIQATAQKCPVAEVLPCGGPFDGTPFFIHTPRADRTILIEIDSTVDFEAAKEAALQWIKDDGYDPNNLGCEIVFKTSDFSG